MNTITEKFNKYLPILLATSIVFNIAFLYTTHSSTLEKDSFCASFKNQATERIRSWYADENSNNTQPTEIFYSKKKGGCIALWSGISTNPANNGYTKNKAVFDPITNREIFSTTLFYFDDISLNPEGQNYNLQAFDELVGTFR